MSTWWERFEDGHRHSIIAEEFPDRNQFPKFYDAKRIYISIGPGDMVYIPPGWYHWIFSEDPDPTTGLNVAINYWYTSNWNMTHVDRYPPIKTTHTIHKNIDYMDFFKTFGDDKLYCSSSNTGHFTYPSSRWGKHGNITCKEHFLTFNEFYEKRTCEDHWYLSGQRDDRLNTYNPSMYPQMELKEANWWINFGNVNTALHYDQTENLLCQIAGSKRVILFPHSEWSNLYLINPYPPEFIQTVLISEQQRRQKYLDPSHVS
jgi:hypothetical protein